MNIKYLILAVLFAVAAAGSIYVRSTTQPVQVSDGEYLCRHAIATGNIIRAKGCI